MSWRYCCSVLAIQSFYCINRKVHAASAVFLISLAKKAAEAAGTPRCTMGAVDTRRMCPSCRAFVTTSDRVCPYCQAPLGARAVERRNPGEILGGLIPHARFTTVLILLINTALFLVQTYVP